MKPEYAFGGESNHTLVVYATDSRYGLRTAAMATWPMKASFRITITRWEVGHPQVVGHWPIVALSVILCI
jgi:hypothetical protein